ncbi:EcsC family protein [Peribacillus kribbensis]|uniref:EcsC family protein n=1 Tax=Peribacillus kribbensis TaxID=356658 RepID=UPI0003F774AF|nr:EcsC family protein [Peribacillus kribbensis]
MESREELLQELAVIEKWEKEQSGQWIWDRLGRLPFKILDKLTPAGIHTKIGSLLDEIGRYIHTGGSYLVKEEAIFEKIQEETGERVRDLQDVRGIPLHAMEKAADSLISSRKKMASIQGASTGIGGIFTLSLDIPAILAISLKTLQEIALIYGYDPNEESERIFIVKCLQFSSADIVGKEAILNELSAYYQGRNGSGEMISQLQGWREVVYTFRDQFGWKKLFQIVPVAGLVFGAFTNRSMVKDLAETGTHFYRKRRIMERLNHTDS